MELFKVERGMKRSGSFDHSAFMKDLFQLFGCYCDGGVSSHALCGDLQTPYCRSALLSAVTKPQNAITFLKTETLVMGHFELPNKSQTLPSSPEYTQVCSC